MVAGVLTFIVRRHWEESILRETAQEVGNIWPGPQEIEMNILTQVVGCCPIVSILARVPQLGLIPVPIDDGGSSLRLVLNFLPRSHRVLGHVGEQLRQGLPLLKIRSMIMSETLIEAINLVLFMRMEDSPCPLLNDRASSSSGPGASILKTVVPIFPLLLARLGAVVLTSLASLTSTAALEAAHHCLSVDAVQDSVEHFECHLCLLVLVELVPGRGDGLVLLWTEQVGVVSTFRPLSTLPEIVHLD